MKRITLAAAIAATLVLGACATTTQTDVQNQISALCPTATAEVETLQSLRADLDANVMSAVDAAAPVIATMCAPGFAATSANLSDFLPAVTVIAVQYAATHK